MKGIRAFLMLVILVTFGLSIPNVITKYNTENSASTVELGVDYKHIYSIAKDGGLDFENKIHQALISKGVTSIGFTENSLYEMESRNLLHVMSGSEIKQNLWSQSYNFSINNGYTYVLVPKSDKGPDVIKTIIDSKLGIAQTYSLKNTTIIEIDKRASDIYRMPVLYLESDYNYLSQMYNIIPRISNDWKDRLPLIENQLKEWNAKKPLSSVVFLGNEAEGYNDTTGKTTTHELWKQIGVGIAEVYTAKGAEKGANNYAYNSNFNIVRVFSIPEQKLETESYNDGKLMVYEGIKERNLRIVYINPFSMKANEAEGSYIKRLKTAIEPIKAGIKNTGYNLGQAKPFKEVQSKFVSNAGIISSLVGVAFLLFLFLTQFTENINKEIKRWITVALVSSILVIVSGYFAGLSNIYVIAPSLGLSMLLPVWASVYTLKTLDNAKGPLNIVKKIGIPIFLLYAVGLTYLISMNHNIADVTYVKTFRGVGLTLGVPPLIVGLIIVFTIRKSLSVKGFLLHKIRIIDILSVVLLGALFVFYHSRSGNGGTLLPYEASIRTWLEDKLPWRPRSKEIFFAFPLLIVMINYWKQSKWTRVLLPFVAIGFASVFNTFTHFHTPMIASIGRSVLSVAFGTVIGGMVCGILRILQDYTSLFKNLFNSFK